MSLISKKQTNVATQQQCLDELATRLPEWILYVEQKLVRHLPDSRANEKTASGFFWQNENEKDYLYWHVSGKTWDEVTESAHRKALRIMNPIHVYAELPF